ncbi:MAG: secondary thiamine-phosphate synthase enzyme YjbQ [Candidatus Margulisiibacteriota bacterium]|nr:secondary thiamine-phosphate synthase enzyme YjbQ [Candidatus Margulisiibacteriota bacterium]
MVKTKRIKLSTKGRDHVINITGEVGQVVTESKIREGIATVFVYGSTASVSTVEYEPGLVEDIKNIDEKLVPSNVSYNHDETWGDANGYAHLRATIYGPSITVPVVSGEMTLGTWQQIIVIDHDNRPRSREVIIQVMGE